ncbi:MAG: hypothetical protein HEEMFOPI_00025 [Holosporales bacterium]
MKNIKFFLLFLMVGFFYSIKACQKDFHLTTLQGQGSFNLVVKKINGVNHGFIFDAGASSEQVHQKMCDSFTPTMVLSPIHKSVDADSYDTDSSEGLTESDDEQSSSAKRIRSLENTPSRPTQLKTIHSGTPATTDRYTVSSSITEDVHRIFKEFNIQSVLIFISHFDADHYNKLYSLPNQVQKVVVCSLEDQSSLNFLQNTLILDIGKIDPIFNMNVPQIFGLSNVQKCVAKNTTNQTFSQIQKLYTNAAFNFIHIWMFDSYFKAKNDKSYLISCTNENSNSSYLFTGDATRLTFKRLIEYYHESPYNLIRRHLSLSKDHLIFAWLPHHGSARHSDLTHLIDCFKPNAFICTSGNGVQYGHPHQSTVRYLKKIYSLQQNQDLLSYFWNRYDPLSKTGCFYFQYERSKKQYKGYLYDVLEGMLPILGTNYGGNLSFDAKGAIFQERGFIINIDGEPFECDISKRSSEKNGTPQQQISKTITPQKSDSKQLCVFDEQQKEYYMLVGVTENFKPKTLFYKLSPKFLRGDSALEGRLEYSPETARSLF